MDRNTTKYMIDELRDQLNAALQEKKELNQALSDKSRTIDSQSQTIDSQSQTIDSQSQTIDSQSQTIDKQNLTITELQQNNTKKDQIIAELKDRINDLYSWLFANDRDEDVKKATSDPEYRAKLFEEFDNSQAKTQEIT